MTNRVSNATSRSLKLSSAQQKMLDLIQAQSPRALLPVSVGYNKREFRTLRSLEAKGLIAIEKIFAGTKNAIVRRKG